MTIKREALDRREIDSSDVTIGQRLPPLHPGEILRDEFLVPMDLSVKHVAKAIGVSPTRLYNIVNRKSNITSDTALRLGHYFGMSPEFWINLPNRNDLARARRKVNLKGIKPFSIEPSETGSIKNKKFDLSEIRAFLLNRGFRNHLQGIAQAGNEHLVLSSSVNDKALLLAHNGKIVQVKCLPKEYDHAGGLGVLEIEGGWMIAVPVFRINQKRGIKGAILRYFLPEGNGVRAQIQGPPTEIISLPTKAYAAGIVRNGNSVVIAVVIDGDGNKIQFWACANPDGNCKYRNWCTWDKGQVPKNKRRDWRPNKKWGGYENSISLISCDDKTFLVGLNGQRWGIFGSDSVEIYRLNVDKDAGNKRLTKKSVEHVRCIGKVSGIFDNPSFCWGGGGSAQIQDCKLVVLAVGPSVHYNRLVEYSKFKIDLNAICLT